MVLFIAKSFRLTINEFRDVEHPLVKLKDDIVSEIINVLEVGYFSLEIFQND